MRSIETGRAPRITSGKSLLPALALLTAALLLFPISAFAKSQNSNMVDLHINKQKYESDFRKWTEKLFQFRAEIVTVADNAACCTALVDPAEALMVVDATICTVSSSADACRSDSGGPPVICSRRRPQLIGIVSWSPEVCGAAQFSLMANSTAPIPAHRAMYRKPAGFGRASG